MFTIYEADVPGLAAAPSLLGHRELMQINYPKRHHATNQRRARHDRRRSSTNDRIRLISGKIRYEGRSDTVAIMLDRWSAACATFWNPTRQAQMVQLHVAAYAHLRMETSEWRAILGASRRPIRRLDPGRS
jgi:hypothetical protein